MCDIKTDVKFRKFLKAKSHLSERTLKIYEFNMDKFCKFIDMSFSKLVSECLDNQNDIIDFEKGQIIRFNKDMSILADYIEEYVYFCRDVGNTEKTIESKIRHVYAILGYFNVQCPSFPYLDVKYQNWNILEKKDIQYALSKMTLDLKAVTTFAACTGERIGDIVEWRIEDHMNNTFEFHKCNELEDYLNTPFNPETIAFYEYYPMKTKKMNVLCRHGVTNECCEYIYYYLQERNAKINQLYDKGVVDRKLLKTDYLFAPKTNPLGKRSRNGIQSSFWRYNGKLREYRIEQYKKELSSNKISFETYKSKIEAIPRFHAHGLRKWFISTVRSNCSNLSICVQMEGHALPLNTDNSYVKINKDLIKEEYFKLIPKLSFNNTEVKILTSEKLKRYEDELDNQKTINKQYNEKFKKLEKFLNEMEQFDFDEF